MKAKNKILSRRRFMKEAVGTSVKSISLATVASGAFTGCAALDRYFEIEKYKFDKEVLIFGAGIAGLTTAYYLKKNKIPYRLFEASSRTGGRVMTQHTNEEDVYFDLGALEFDEYDKNVLDLLKELNLETDDRNSSSFKNSFGFINRQMVFPFKQLLDTEAGAFKSWNKELIRIKKATADDESYEWLLDEKIMAYESLFLRDIFRDSALNQQSKLLLKSWAEFYFQKSESEITFLNWLMMLEKETLQNKKLKVKNGMEELTIHLTQRVGGVIPNYNLQLPAKLIEIQRSNENWLCQIQTKEGVKRISSPYVVMALPFTELKKVKGIENIFVSQDFLKLAKNCENKNTLSAVAQLKTKAIKKPKQLSQFVVIDKHTFKIRLEDNFAIFHFNTENEFNWFLNEKNLAFNFFNSKDFNFMSSIDWSKITYINGSQLSFKQKEAILLKKSLNADWSKSSLQLAGDYVISPFSSNLNDTIQSAINAVENIKLNYFEKFSV
ncbi:MAG: FAD-dependent oxidoreductase [Deltaproteobacteria bacterium]|nr:FAD-dependent oxidoreductase [Deltaproteobacteria bacterium]